MLRSSQKYSPLILNGGRILIVSLFHYRVPTLLGNSASSSGNDTTSNPSQGPSDTNTSTVNPPKKSSNTGAIVGGIISGVAVIALIIFGLFFLRRRRRQSSFDAEKGSPDPVPFRVSPTSTRAIQSGTVSSKNSQSLNPSSNHVSPRHSNVATNSSGPVSYTTSSSSELTGAFTSVYPDSFATPNHTNRHPIASKSRSVPPSRGARSTVTMETDAGSIAEDNPVPSTLLPPAYDPTWGR